MAHQGARREDPSIRSWRLARRPHESLSQEWGCSWYGQCDIPAPNTDFVAVAGGGYHSLGLKTDGSIVVWGYNDDVALAAGYQYGLGLKSAPPCPADLDDDELVNISDLLVLLSASEECP